MTTSPPPAGALKTSGSVAPGSRGKVLSRLGNKDSWLEVALDTSNSYTDTIGLPSAAKDSFQDVIMILECVQRMKSGKPRLKGICMSILECCKTMVAFYTNQQQTQTSPDICADLCSEFRGLLKDLQETLSTLESKMHGFISHIKENILHNRTKEIITKQEKKLQIFSHRLQIFATLDTVFMLRADLSSLAVDFLDIESLSLPVISGQGNLVNNTIINSTVANVVISGLGNNSISFSLPAERPAEIVQIQNCPQPIRFFCGRTEILDRMAKYFNIDIPGQKTYLLYGLGGIGKTQIAHKFLANMAERFTDIWLVNSNIHTTIQAGYKKIMVDKNLPSDPVRWLEQHNENWIVLFDNADDPDLDLQSVAPSQRRPIDEVNTRLIANGFQLADSSSSPKSH
ncbi:hypothetical protein MKEN_01401500 [Mycena kentingensis (nom. inval.)]|nr:hypothetical protein MKEN_01401500 [Mycena kentingensis (nom. inval.)]